MRLFLDDMRKSPFGWYHVLTADECIDTIARLNGRVEELSLDHDLHEEHYDTSRNPATFKHKTGMAVVEWLCSLDDLFRMCIWPKVIYVHSLNEYARARMVDALRQKAPHGCRVVDRPMYEAQCLR